MNVSGRSGCVFVALTGKVTLLDHGGFAFMLLVYQADLLTRIS